MIKDSTYYRTMMYLENTPTKEILIHAKRNGQWVDVDIADATDEDLNTFVTIYPKLTAQWTIILARFVRDQLSMPKSIS